MAATPATVTYLVRLGYEVVVESRAGAASRFADHAYVDAALPGKNALNIGALVAFAGLTAWFVASPNVVALIIVTVLALALGLHLVASIGGGDMPVVVSTLATPVGRRPPRGSCSTTTR